MTVTTTHDATITVFPGGAAQVCLPGEPEIAIAAPLGATVDEGRYAALGEVRRAASSSTRPLTVATTDPDGSWLLRVHPDGRVEPLHEPNSTVPAVPVPAVDPVLVSIHADAPAPAPLPTLGNLLAARPPAKPPRATVGWRAGVRRATGGILSPAPGPAELAHRGAVRCVQRSLDGPKTIVVVNPKGGAFKTTASLLIAQACGVHRGGSTLAWDNNETRGTMGWRAQHTPNTTTATDLLGDIDRFTDQAGRFGDLGNYVRNQGDARFDVLASHEDPRSARSIDAQGFADLHRVLTRYYRLLVVDTGNNMLAANWRAAVEAADQLVVVSSVREDTAQSAAWLADSLQASPHAAKLRDAVTVLAAPSPSADRAQRGLRRRLGEHFEQLTRRVLDVPYDRQLVDGGPIDFDSLSQRSREAWLQVTAAVVDGL